MPTPKKIAVVQDLGTRLDKASAVYIADYSGMNVTTLTELRSKLRDANAELRVVKNNLIRLSLAETDWADAGKNLHGPSSMTLAYGEAPVVAKVLKRFAAFHNDRPVVKAIGYAGEVHSGEFLGTLSTMPTRTEALGMLAGVLNSIIASFARALNAVREKTETAGVATPAAALLAVPAPVPAPDEPAVVVETAPDTAPEAAGGEADGGAEA